MDDGSWMMETQEWTPRSTLKCGYSQKKWDKKRTPENKNKKEKTKTKKKNQGKKAPERKNEAKQRPQKRKEKEAKSPSERKKWGKTTPSIKKRKRGKTPTEKKNEAKQRPQKWEIHRIQMADTSTKSNTVTTTASSSRMDLQKWDTLRHQRRLQSRSAANKSQCNGSLFRMGPKLSATATYHIIPLHSRDTCQTQSRCLKVWVVTDAANARRSSQYPHG